MSGTLRSIYPFVIQLATGLVAVFAGVLACGSHLPAQTPSGPQPPTDNSPIRVSPAETTFPAGFPPLVEPTADPAAAERIQRALQGGMSGPVPGGVLGDVIDIIRTQGSILDGSSLDPRMVAPERVPESNDDISPTEIASSSVQAAEALLRSARLLESIPTGPVGPRGAQLDRLPIAELIRQMRIQATRLLATEFPQAID